MKYYKQTLHEHKKILTFQTAWSLRSTTRHCLVDRLRTGPGFGLELKWSVLDLKPQFLDWCVRCSGEVMVNRVQVLDINILFCLYSGNWKYIYVYKLSLRITSTLNRINVFHILLEKYFFDTRRTFPPKAQDSQPVVLSSPLCAEQELRGRVRSHERSHEREKGG